MFAKLGVLPYKGPEVAVGVHLYQMHSYLLLALHMLLALVLIAELLLPSEDLKGFDMAILVVKLVHLLSPVP
jgi:hypothetical protein